METRFRKSTHAYLRMYVAHCSTNLHCSEDIDFGIYQMSAIVDRSDTKGSQFQVLTTFGDHSLHHLFPPLDQGILPQLYPTFLETCAEFEVEYRERPWWHMFFAQYKQLARIDPITYVPGRKTK